MTQNYQLHYLKYIKIIQNRDNEPQKSAVPHLIKICERVVWDIWEIQFKGFK